MGLKRRLDLCRAYFSPNRDFDCSWRDLLGELFRSTCTMRAKPQISKIVDAGDYKLIYLRNMGYPLYWPRDIPLYNLYMVISESLYEDGWHYYEVPETKVKPGDVVLDCGAAEGLFTLKNLEHAQCIVIEPSPVFIGSLAKTFDDKSNVQIIPCALSSKAGKAYLSPGTINSFLTNVRDKHPEGFLMVNTTTIDQLVVDLGLARVDYIKGDLESFELEVLQGAVETIINHKPKIAFTTYHERNDWKEMRDFVLSLVPNYAWRVKGLSYLQKSPKPVMIHFWQASHLSANSISIPLSLTGPV
jgi:FkbM family methyltransferase